MPFIEMRKVKGSDFFFLRCFVSPDTFGGFYRPCVMVRGGKTADVMSLVMICSAWNVWCCFRSSWVLQRTGKVSDNISFLRFSFSPDVDEKSISERSEVSREERRKKTGRKRRNEKLCNSKGGRGKKKSRGNKEWCKRKGKIKRRNER